MITPAADSCREQPLSAAIGCGVTVLRTDEGRFATKRWAWSVPLQEWRKVSYEAGAWFAPTEHPVGNLTELVTVLDAVRRDPRAFVVRGALTDAAKTAGRIRRRKHLKGGVQPTLVEVERQWLMIDVDNWPLRPMDDLAADPELAIDAAIHALLPPAFHDAECWWQLSSSAGFATGMLKVHLFYWLDRPATNAHVKAVFEQHAPDIDRAPFSAAQPHYIADPIIDGAHDPLPRRTGWRQGIEQSVTLPALRPVVRAPAPANATGRSGTVDGALARLGHGEGRNGFHAPLRAATLLYASQVARDGNEPDDHEPIKAFLRAAIRAAPCRSGGDVEHPYCEDHYLDSLIDGAFAFLAGDAEIRTMRPHYTAPTDTLANARGQIQQHVVGFFDRVLIGGDVPEHAGLKVAVGTGKTTITMAELPRFIAAAKDAGRPYRIIWAVPTHKLGNDTLAQMQALGINAAVYRGRKADVPGTGEPDEYIEPTKMCLNTDAVDDAIKVRATIETAVCGSDAPGKPHCPWRTGADQCEFQKQKPIVARADVVIMAHQGLFHTLPKSIRADLAAVIVDESWWQAGLMPPRDLDLATFALEPLTYPVRRTDPVFGAKVQDDLATNDLHAIAAKAQEAISHTADGGFVGKARVESTGLTASDCHRAVALEWRRLVDNVVTPGQTARARRAALKQGEGNAAIPTRVAVWEALAALLDGTEAETGRLQVNDTSITVHSRREVRDEVAELPILLLDATMPVDVVRRFLPRFTLLADIQPAAPFMAVTQIIGPFGKTSLVPHDKATDAENKRRKELVRELADFAGLNSGGNGLVVTYQGIEAEFQRPGMRTGHFNAIAGLDAYKDVRAGFIVGRPMPDARELRDMALALTGRPIAVEAGQVETRAALMADGTGQPIRVRTYADPDLEALRAAVVEAEMVQAIGRVRGCNREADNPVTVYVFADVVLPLPVTRMVVWDHVRPNVMQRMAARGVVLTSPTDAARVYPDLFVSVKAAEHALGRATPQTPMEDSYIGKWGDARLVEVIYRPDGKGMKARRALVTPDRLVGLAEWLTERLGVLVRLIEPPPPPEPLDPPADEEPMAQPMQQQPPPQRQPLIQEPVPVGLFRCGAVRVLDTDCGLAFRVMPGRPPPRPVEASAACAGV